MAFSLATHWKRLASYIVDALILSIFVTKPLSSLLENSIPNKVTDIFSVDFKSLFLITFLISVINLLYWVILEYKLQQTLGGLIFNIYARSESNKLTLNQVFIRNLTKISSLLLIIDSIGIFTSKKRQRFTERFTKTLTIEDG